MLETSMPGEVMSPLPVETENQVEQVLANHENTDQKNMEVNLEMVIERHVNEIDRAFEKVKIGEKKPEDLKDVFLRFAVDLDLNNATAQGDEITRICTLYLNESTRQHGEELWRRWQNRGLSEEKQAA